MALKHLFVDMNAFFASVEQQERPELRERPVAVVPVMAETTCCIAASHEAKQFGIQTGTKVSDARKLCSGLCVVEARPVLYIQVHHRMVRAVDSCLPVTAVKSIDEVTCRLAKAEQPPKQAVRVAEKVKAAVRRDLGPWLRCSIGLAPNQLLAKVAADMQKPDGLTVIRREELPGRLHALELRDFPGIGPRMERRFRSSGVTTVEQMCRLSVDELARIWSSRWLGRLWWQQLRGDEPPETPTRRRTISHSHVLPPSWRNDAGARAVLLRLMEKAAARLRHVDYWAGAIGVSVQFVNGAGWDQHARLGLCQDTLTLIRATERLWERRPAGIPIRVGVSLSELAEGSNVAAPLFEEDQKRLALSAAMDAINQKYGAHAVCFAGMHQARGQAPTRIAFNRIPDLSLADA